MRWRAFLLASVILPTGCSTVHIPLLSPDRRPTPSGLPNELRTSVEKLAAEIGERNCYRPSSLEAAAMWIEQQFTDAGFKPRLLPVTVPAGPPFDCGAMTVRNIEAEK